MFVDLGKRLACIATQISKAHKSKPFDQIWDCCCDHGYLGIALMHHFSKQAEQPPQINFIDQVEHITQQLRTTLNAPEYKNFQQRFQVITKDSGQLIFPPTQNHCIIIAGVTTNGMLKQIKQILSNHPLQELDFILCPTRGIYDLRHFLISEEMSLINEFYIKENDRHYEVLHVTSQSKKTNSFKELSPIGDFWHCENTEHLEYLESRIQYHEQEAQHTNRADTQKAWQLYSEMKDLRFNNLAKKLKYNSLFDY